MIIKLPGLNGVQEASTNWSTILSRSPNALLNIVFFEVAILKIMWLNFFTTVGLPTAIPIIKMLLFFIELK